MHMCPQDTYPFILASLSVYGVPVPRQSPQGTHNVSSLGDADGHLCSQHPSLEPGTLPCRGDRDTPRSRPSGWPAHISN